MGKLKFFGALRALKMIILLNFAQKSLIPPRGFGRIFTWSRSDSSVYVLKSSRVRELERESN